jgi:hypothetical protein
MDAGRARDSKHGGGPGWRLRHRAGDPIPEVLVYRSRPDRDRGVVGGGPERRKAHEHFGELMVAALTRQTELRGRGHIAANRRAVHLRTPLTARKPPRRATAAELLEPRTHGPQRHRRWRTPEGSHATGSNRSSGPMPLAGATAHGGVGVVPPAPVCGLTIGRSRVRSSVDATPRGEARRATVARRARARLSAARRCSCTAVTPDRSRSVPGVP